MAMWREESKYIIAAVVSLFASWKTFNATSTSGSSYMEMRPRMIQIGNTVGRAGGRVR